MVCLLYLVHNGFEGFWVVHGQIGQDFPVKLDFRLVQSTHQGGRRQAVQPGTGIDPLNPETPEIALFGPTVAVGVP
jgi:hypothetical protein